MLPDVRQLSRFFVYQYTFLDDDAFILDPFDYFIQESRESIEEFIQGVRQLFIRSGWEGDGDIGLIWLPPFVDCGVEDTWGTYIWHVKQDNNGVSFLASEYRLEFERLRDQNEDFISPLGRHSIAVNIIQGTVDTFLKQISQERLILQEMISHLRKNSGDEVVEKIISSVTINSQSILLRYLHEFLDECYLQFLIEVIDGGNPSKIKIRKSQVYLAPSQYIPEDSLEEGYSGDVIEGGRWFTLKGVVGDMWRAFKFESFKNKIEMLFKSIDFEWDTTKLSDITKHVVLRSCIQHHEGVLDNESIKQIGLAKVLMHDKNGLYEIGPWKSIWFSDVELSHLCDL